MKRFTKGLLAAAVAVALVGGLVLNVSTAEAQGRRGGAPNWSNFAGLIGACSTTDYTSVAAQALGMTPTELRVALAGGANLTAIAAQKGVDITTVQEALRTARLAEVDKALADGLITQAQADQLKALLSGQTVTPPMAPGLRGRMGLMIGRANLLAGVSVRNTVKPYIVAAEALGISCVELVKAAQAGQSIAQVATSKGVALQTVVDALSKAYSDALAKDVEEGLVAPVRAQAIQAQIINNVLRIISQPHDRFGLPRLPRIGAQFFGGELPTDAFGLLGIHAQGAIEQFSGGN
ncbi:MAG: hypothetical protein CUN51_04280 [Candidatus Thermofonsia Clade 1 bacterium]|uniref:DUF937 domain-containing protein n=1 Tax=Candidatus Thermofonsia Clade 1 bacterium TaxID=2364210 RepID=A0A2M8P1Y7_9CHLR|nr:MAG: hypothetical protein CUN51_04280 [Candidatus Thermofonsia Clade 1 bacterium]